MKSTVYFTKDISSQGLMKIYKALGVSLKEKVGVKLSTGEPGGHNFLQPSLIKELVQSVEGTIIECNTAYKGKRRKTEDHLQTVKDHGFTAIAPCDIMDADSEMSIPVTNGHHLSENFVGSNLKNYSSLLVLSHFKGHVMGGYGGALKNISIGIASAAGKAHIHGVGEPEKIWTADRQSFLECMADASASVIDYIGAENMAYINIANNISIDCDCDPNPKAPEMADIGIFASLDPVAVDQAAIDAIYNSPDEGKASLIERIESINGVHTIEAANALKLGNREYEIVNID